MTDRPLLSPDLERALRWASTAHQGQVRRGSGVPYFEHVVAVAMIVDRLGFGEDVVVAGLLHDVVEDTPATFDEVRARFGPAVADLVAHCSEVKTEAGGRERPWNDRKRDHLAALAAAPVEARAVALADKLHNLLSIACDLRDGRPVWSLFHADRGSVLGYYRAALDTLGAGDPRLSALAAEARRTLDEVEASGEPPPSEKNPPPPAPPSIAPKP
ncbi:MAG: HD domain-containing protein [Planctomycetia bacterium]|nr:HD domain-containing protein [Planctomycetia bacterium]